MGLRQIPSGERGNTGPSGSLFAPRRRLKQRKIKTTPSDASGKPANMESSSSSGALFFECLLDGKISSLQKIVGDGSNFIPDNVDDEINTIMTQKLYSTENNYDFTDRDSPWMQAMRRKVAQGGISYDSRFEVAEKLWQASPNF